MAEKITENQFDRQGVNPFNAPIPGESLTTSPDMQKSWERPPRFTNPDDCMENIYLELTSEEALPELVNMINDGSINPDDVKISQIKCNTKQFEIVDKDEITKLLQSAIEKYPIEKK